MSSCSFHASKEATGTCTNCGKLICRACNSEIDGKSYCPPCVEKLFTTSQTAAIAEATPALAAVKNDGQEINLAWWLLPVFLTWAGGLAAWLVNKERNARMARYMLFAGIGMAFIQGLAAVILVVSLLVPPTTNIGRKPSTTTSVPPATALPSATSQVPTSTTSKIPSPGAARTQPADYKVQEAKIDQVIGHLCTAFKSKDIEAALKYFQEEEREKYRKVFSQSPEVLPKMAVELEKAKINFLSFKSDQYSRTAEYLIKFDGQDFSIIFIEVEGQWMLKKF